MHSSALRFNSLNSFSSDVSPSIWSWVQRKFRPITSKSSLVCLAWRGKYIRSSLNQCIKANQSSDVTNRRVLPSVHSQLLHETHLKHSSLHCVIAVALQSKQLLNITIYQKIISPSLLYTCTVYTQTFMLLENVFAKDTSHFCACQLLLVLQCCCALTFCCALMLL